MYRVEIKFVREDSKVKKSKKFVVAGLVLAAITMVLLPLAGCKMEVDTNQFTTAAKRKGY